jgi:serine/threonine-protein phosphatase 2A regulatory subunit A
VPVDFVRKYFLAVLTVLQTDRVANVRMNVAKTVQVLIPMCKNEPDILNVLKNTLNVLQSDTDSDVKYFSSRAQKCL